MVSDQERFMKALGKIHPRLRELPGARFVPIQIGTKTPEGLKWNQPGGANYAADDRVLGAWLHSGHNYGVCTGFGGLAVVDVDDHVRLEALGITAKIPNTFTVKTGRGGLHFYFLCPELEHKIGLYDTELMDSEGDRLHLGEVQSVGQQVVGPGSLHPNGNHYEVVHDAPIATVTKADLLSWFDDLILTGVEDETAEAREVSRRRAGRGGGLGDHIRIDDVAWPKAVKSRSGAEIKGSHPIHGSETGQNFSINTEKNCWHCFRHGTGGGPLEWLAVEERMISCADAKPNGLRGDKLRRVIEIARSRGFYIPDSKPATSAGAMGLSMETLTKVVGREKVLNSEGIPTKEEAPKRTLSPSKAAKAITGTLELRLDHADSKDKPDLWRYDGGIWKKDGEREVVKLIDEAVGDLSYDRGLRETLRRIRNTSEAVQFNADPALFPTLDGVVDLKTGKFREARAEDYLTFRHNVSYDLEGADYSPFLWFLCSSLPDPRDVLTALDIVTAVALRVPLDIIVLLFGGGANGKGIFEKTMLALFNSERSTALQLEELAKSRFGPGALLNKDMWIVSEVESVKDATSALKRIATGEMIDTDVKYGGRITGRPHLVPILDANLPFSFNDDSYGRKRRIVKLDFPFTFGDDPGTLPRDPHLEEKLTRPEVLAGIARIIAARAPSLLETRKVYRRKSAEEQEEEYRRQQFSLSFFCEECLGTEWEDPDRPAERLLVDRAYAEYLEYCRLFHVTAPAECIPFGKYMKERFNSTSIATRERGKGIRYYPGVFLLKSARLVHAEFSLSNRSNSTATEEQQKEDSKTPIISWIATEATEELLIKVYTEIEQMFRYLSKYRDTNSSTWQDFVSYESYLKTPVASVASVADNHCIAISPQTPCCSSVAEVTSSVAVSIEDPPTLAGELAEADRRAVEWEERYKTPLPVKPENCPRCGKPITGPGGKGGRDGVCLRCWQRDHPRPLSEAEEAALIRARELLEKERSKVTPFTIADRARSVAKVNIAPARVKSWLEEAGQ